MKGKPSKRKRAQAKSKSRVASAAAGKCACGCGAEVTRRFKQGHDMRMRPGSQWLKQHPEFAGRHV
jgi:hypothetical protein